jgi:cytochrome d ubiquinol oxidase subunit I
MFVLGISAYYLLKGRDLAFARRSFAIAAAFGLASSLSVIVLGDESGYEIGDVQKTKLAVIEAEWETEPAPAAFTLFGMPNDETMETDYAIKIPYVMGIIATRSLDEQVTGIKDLIVEHEQRIRNGMYAYELLQRLRNGEETDELKAEFDRVKVDLGFGLLLKKYTDNVVDATEEQIKMAARDTIPSVAPMFWAFRLMVACGFWMLLVFALAFYYTARRTAFNKPWLLRMALFTLPAPWIASEMGWFVAEFGRQPWAIGEILPTYVAPSVLSQADLIGSLIGFIGLYTLLAIVEMYLMIRFSRIGPSSLHTGRYHHEQNMTTASESAKA